MTLRQILRKLGNQQILALQLRLLLVQLHNQKALVLKQQLVKVP
jgi:hypothetical protein